MVLDLDRNSPMNGTPVPVIDGLLRACCRSAGLDGAGVTVLTADGSREPLYASDETAETIERLQLTLGEGPCVDCSTAGTPVLVPDLADECDAVIARWPFFRDEALPTGVRAVFAFPLRIGAIWLGEIDFHRHRPGPLSPPALGAVLSAVDEVGLAVLEGSEHRGLEGSTVNVIVHQAAGMVMAQLDSSIEDAMLRLRAAAFAEDTSLTELSLEIVERRRRLTEEDS